jgi:hypothetical protein
MRSRCRILAGKHKGIGHWGNGRIVLKWMLNVVMWTGLACLREGSSGVLTGCNEPSGSVSDGMYEYFDE